MQWCMQWRSQSKSNHQQDSVPGPFVSDLHEAVASFLDGIVRRWSTTATYLFRRGQQDSRNRDS